MKKIGCISFLLSGILILTGIGLLCGAGFYNSIWEAERDQCSDTTTGVVSEIVENMRYDSHNNSRLYTYQSSVKYTVNNVEYSSVDSVGYGKDNIPYAIGDSVTVHYNPDSPKKMYISEKEMSKVPTVFTIIGGVLIGLAVLVLILSAFSGKKNSTVE